ncbi:hypothetical protein D3C87_94780 [compost metagenome]
MLQETYIKLLENYTDDRELIGKLWSEIEANYSGEKRHYHTLLHLENLLKQLIPVKEQVENWETVLFTLYYHDIIYDALRSDNEEQSAELAEKRMKQIHVPAQVIENCKKQILATKTHLENANPDTNYFTDSDLSVLGQETKNYREYSKNVRLEYAYYPDAVYNEGRIKVLNHFLNLERIFKTDYFHKKYEKQATQNILEELKSLEERETKK